MNFIHIATLDDLIEDPKEKEIEKQASSLFEQMFNSAKKVMNNAFLIERDFTDYQEDDHSSNIVREVGGEIEVEAVLNAFSLLSFLNLKYPETNFSLDQLKEALQFFIREEKELIQRVLDSVSAWDPPLQEDSYGGIYTPGELGYDTFLDVDTAGTIDDNIVLKFVTTWEK